MKRVLGIVLLTLVARTAAADPARELVDQGIAAARSARYADAAQAFHEAYLLSHNPALLYGEAIFHEQAHAWPEAYAAYRAYHKVRDPRLHEPTLPPLRFLRTPPKQRCKPSKTCAYPDPARTFIVSDPPGAFVFLGDILLATTPFVGNLGNVTVRVVGPTGGDASLRVTTRGGVFAVELTPDAP